MRLYLHLFVFVLSTTATAAAAAAEGNADVADNSVEDDSLMLKPLQLPPHNNDNDSDQEQDGGAASGTDTDQDPITSALEQIIQQSLSELKNHPSLTNIVIENEIVDNSFIDSVEDGVVFSPNIDFNNDMHGFLVGNNNAESESGNVKRQNGVADFQGALKGNNNAHSEAGDVVRQNGVMAADYEQDADEDALDAVDAVDADTDHVLPPPSRRLKHGQESESNSEDDGSSTSWAKAKAKDKETEHSGSGTKAEAEDDEKRSESQYLDKVDSVMSVEYDEPKNTLTIRNKISGNTVTKTRQKGIIVSPQITFVNDMSESFHDNNNARSVEGNVDRQNGVADFRDALQENNNAFSVEGDVTRQNGVLGLPSGSGSGGGGGSGGGINDAWQQLLQPDVLKTLFDAISNHESNGGGLSKDLQEMVKEVVAQKEDNSKAGKDLTDVVKELINLGDPSSSSSSGLLEKLVRAYKDFKSDSDADESSSSSEDEEIDRRYLRGGGK
eukprot:scaffold14002_cov83-Skeletonema_dohrnii-CCMP3373.AAC.3